MIVHTKWIILLPVALSLAGCGAYRMEELRQVTPVGTVFQRALIKEYRNFSTLEEKQYDWFAAAYFSEKGLLIAYQHKDALPEDPAQWKIKKEALPEFKKARAKLITALSKKAKALRPNTAAKTLVAYDRWVEQQREEWQIDDINYRRGVFYTELKKLTAPYKATHTSAVKKLKTKAKSKPAAKTAVKAAVKAAPKAAKTKKPEAATKPITQDTENASYIALFGPNGVELNSVSQVIVDAAAKSLLAKQSYRAIITVDIPPGSDPTLASARAEVIKQRLLLAGVKSSAIDIVAVTTAHSPPPAVTPIPVERQVEIFISE